MLWYISKFLFLILFTPFKGLSALENDSSDNNETRTASIDPPIARAINSSFTIHNLTINDEYSWLIDPNWPYVKNKDIVDYVEKENVYANRYFAPYKSLEEKILVEMIDRIKIKNYHHSPYERRGDYYYYSRLSNNDSRSGGGAADNYYKINCRKYKSIDAPEEIILDENELWTRNNNDSNNVHKPSVQLFAISPNGNLLAYMIDLTAGNELLSTVVQIVDLDNKICLSDRIADVSGNIIWHKKLNGFFYQRFNNDTSRFDKLFFHKLGDDVKKDKLVFVANEQINNTDVANNYYRSFAIGQSGSEKFMFLYVMLEDYSGNEIRALNLEETDLKTFVVAPMRKNVLSTINHRDDRFYLRTNDDNARNYKIIRIEDRLLLKDDADDREALNAAAAEVYVNEDKSKSLESFYLTKDYLILSYNDKGLTMIKIKNLSDEESKEKIVEFPDASYVAQVQSVNYDSNELKISYSSLSRPDTTYSYDFTSGNLIAMNNNADEYPENFDPNDYTVERVYAVSSDENVRVPISLVYKNSLFNKTGANPLYLYAYGSYGIGAPANFHTEAITLADRGFVYAVAHVRGGNELGDDWHEVAKKFGKKLSRRDFVESIEYLVKMGYAAKDKIACSGSGAGGTLIAATINEERPREDLRFKAVVMHVPVVDLLNSLIKQAAVVDDSGEFDEWGDPKDLEQFNFVRSYSPCDNVKSKDYPNMLVTGEFMTTKFSYWEEAKFVAKLRKLKTDANTLLLKVNLDAQFDEAVARMNYFAKIANEIVFILSIFKKT